MYTVKKLSERQKDKSGCCPSINVGGKYVNPWPSSKSQSKKSHSLETVFRVLTRKSFKKLPEEKYVKVDVDLKAINDYSKNERKIAMQLVWFGHAATLLQINGFNILFDPLLTSRASPVPFAGPYRYRSRGFKNFSELPQIDILVISHNHYDHLDKKSIKEMLKEKKNRNLHIFCPVGLKKWFLKRFNLSKNQITEGDWWDDFEISKPKDTSFETTLCNNKIISTIGTNNNSLSSSGTSLIKSIHSSSYSSLTTTSSSSFSNISSGFPEKKLIVSCVPAQHSSRRGLCDGNKTLWAGWAVRSHYVSFYFSGDTGYRGIPENCTDEERQKYPCSPFFAQIGNIYGPFDYACIPIGPSNDTNAETPVHVDPTDAINIHKDVKSRRSIPIHWGTLANYCTIEITHDPKELQEAMKKSGLPPEEFDIVYIGQVLKILKKDALKTRIKV